MHKHLIKAKKTQHETSYEEVRLKSCIFCLLQYFGSPVDQDSELPADLCQGLSSVGSGWEGARLCGPASCPKHHSETLQNTAQKKHYSVFSLLKDSS